MWTEEKVGSPYKELMTYQAEMNNGGHSQYFFNVENVSGDIKTELSALEQILSPKLIDNMKKAYNAHLAFEENENHEVYEDILEQCDDVFYENEVEVNHILEEYALKIEL